MVWYLVKHRQIYLYLYAASDLVHDAGPKGRTEQDTTRHNAAQSNTTHKPNRPTVVEPLTVLHDTAARASLSLSLSLFLFLSRSSNLGSKSPRTKQTTFE